MTRTSDSSKQTQVSIIVLTWNQCELTLACLDSLSRMEYSPEKMTIFLVDNNSGDDTVASVQRSYPRVKIIENKTNLGFAEGNNVGLREALRTRPDHILLLNNDTIVDKMMLANLIDRMDQEVDCGIVGPKMLYHEPSDLIWAAGNRINLMTGESIRLQAEQLDDESDEAPKEVDFITACGILLKREVIDEIGLLDQRVFIYYEETDWCMRARNAGWRIMYEPRAKLWHKISAAMGSSSPATDYYMSRNSFLFLAKNLLFYLFLDQYFQLGLHI